MSSVCGGILSGRVKFFCFPMVKYFPIYWEWGFSLSQSDMPMFKIWIMKESICIYCINRFVNSLFALFGPPCMNDVFWYQIHFTAHFIFFRSPSMTEPRMCVNNNGRKLPFCSMSSLFVWLVFFLPNSLIFCLCGWSFFNWGFVKCTFPFRIFIAHLHRHSCNSLPPYVSSAFCLLHKTFTDLSTWVSEL